MHHPLVNQLDSIGIHCITHEGINWIQSGSTASCLRESTGFNYTSSPSPSHTLTTSSGNRTSVFKSMSFFSAEGFICAICSIPERRGIKGSLSFSIALISLRVGVSICSYVAGNGFLWFFLYGRVMFHFVPVHYLPNAIICPWTFCWYP